MMHIAEKPREVNRELVN